MASSDELIPQKPNPSVSSDPIFLDSSTLHSLLSYSSLLQHLQSSLPTISSTTHSPIRHHHTISPSPSPSPTPSPSSLLLMPSWSLSPSFPYLGVKIVTSFPQNSARNLPGINASYLLFDSTTGRTLAVMSGTELTLWRTSCVSALASKYLSREDVGVLVMIGAGALAPYLVKAHLWVRPSLKRVIIWNRNGEKARELVKMFEEEGEIVGVCFEHGECLEKSVGLGDIITCATSSSSAIVKGSAMKLGSHLDLVGSFTPSMRECDDEAIKRGRVFVDGDAAMVEAGELVGVSEENICGRLVNLISGDKIGRCSKEDITVFKSVGSAVVDLATAQFVYETFLHRNNNL